MSITDVRVPAIEREGGPGNIFLGGKLKTVQIAIFVEKWFTLNIRTSFKAKVEYRIKHQRSVHPKLKCNLLNNARREARQDEDSFLQIFPQHQIFPTKHILTSSRSPAHY